MEKINYSMNEQLVLEGVFDAVPAGLVLVDNSFTITRLNRWAEENFARGDEWLGKKCHELLHDHASPVAECPAARALKSRRVETAIVSMLLAGGQQHWVSVTALPVIDKNDHINGFIEYFELTSRQNDDLLQHVMLEISNAVHTTADTVDLIRKIRDILSMVIDTSNFFVALHNKENDTLELPFYVDEHDSFEEIPPGKTLTAHVMQRGLPTLLKEEDMERMWREGLVDRFGGSAKVWMGAPLVVQDETVGVLVVQNYDNADAYGERELNIVKFVSEQIAIAIERKQTEEDLKHEKALMRALMENTTDFIYCKDRQGRFIKSSRTHYLSLGATCPEEVIGKTDYDYHPYDVVKTFEADEAIILQTGESIINKEEKSFRFTEADWWFSTSKNPIRDENGNIIGTFGVTRDITKQKRAEMELRQSEIQYRTALNAFEDAIHVIDTKFRIILANDALTQWFKALGLEHNVLGKELAIVCPFLSADVFRQYEQVFATGEMMLTFEESAVGPDTYYTETRKIPIFEGDRVIQVLTIVRDITTRRQREAQIARLAMAVEQTGESIMIVSKDEIIEYVNPAFERITGFSAQELIGKKSAILKDNYFGAELYDQIWKTILTGATWNGHVVSFHQDGSRYEQDLSLSPIYDNDGVLQSFAAVARDMTKEITMQRQLMRSRKMEAIGTLAGGVAHDFNNILASIIGFAQLSQMRTEPGSKLERNIRNILTACDRARDLTQQILLYSRGDDQEKNPLRIDLAVLETIKLLKASLPATISIVPDIQKNCSSILGNATQIHQILMNLATNAAHAMPDRIGAIRIGLREVLISEKTVDLVEPGIYVQLSVQDNGKGIPEEIQDRIFDPFFTTKTNDMGTGLGLSVVHGIIKSLEGYISVKSQVGHGTTMTILFPAINNAGGNGTMTQNKILENGSETILFVDDEPSLVEIGDNILHTLGYHVVATTSSRQALEIFQANPAQFHMVITDQTMPEMTGEKLAQHVRSIDPTIPILLCTGFSDTITAQAESNRAIDKILLKPFYIDELAHTIRDILDSRK